MAVDINNGLCFTGLGYKYPPVSLHPVRQAAVVHFGVTRNESAPVPVRVWPRRGEDLATVAPAVRELGSQRMVALQLLLSKINSPVGRE